jgi:hypothetical protein
VGIIRHYHMSIAFRKIKNELGLDDVFPFGRHQGYTVLEVVKDRPDYIAWLVINTSVRFHISVLEQAVKYTLESRREKRYNNYLNTQDSNSDDALYLEGFDDVPF